MRAQPVASGTLARPAVSLLLSLLLGGPAWAAGSVTFTQMIVERCPEKSCEWRLSCGVGGPQETELFAGAEARTKYKVNINHTLDAPQFPATIHCTAWEDDGWFSPSWEKVGSGSVEVPAGGNYRLELSSPEQGTVRVLMAVDSLDIAIPAPAAAPPATAPKKGSPAKPAAALQFAAAFNPSPDGRAVVVGMEWKPFREMVDKLKDQGLQIDDVETFEQGGKRLWNGIFHNSQDQVVLLADQDWEKFKEAWKKLTGGKMRLADLEVYRKGGETMLAGIFRDLGESHSFLVGETRKDFEAKVKDIAANKGQRPLDFEAYKLTTPVILYAGCFRQTAVESQLWTNLNQAAFEAKLAGLRGKEWRVVDLETYKEGKERSYDALLRTGPPGEVALGLDAAALTARWRELAKKGLRLVSLEVYQE
jgi:Polyglycine hydrolase-like, structural repeat